METRGPDQFALPLRLTLGLEAAGQFSTTVDGVNDQTLCKAGFDIVPRVFRVRPWGRMEEVESLLRFATDLERV